MDFKTSLDIPPPYGQLFECYERFNAVQVSLLDDLLRTDKSVVLRAPTGAGKTVAFELAIVRMLQQSQQESEHQHAGLPLKAIYVAPTKALCFEKFSNWQKRFTPLNVVCAHITGDSNVEDLIAIRDAQLVITTPEKWDSLTRCWQEYFDVANAVHLFMIDEIHLLNDAERGPILEAIVSRMKAISNAREPKAAGLRFIAASATIPNIEDLTCWIGGGNCENVVKLVYGDSQRSVPLEKHIIGFSSNLGGFKFDMSLNYKLSNVLKKYSENKAALIFCNSRKSTEMAATVLEKEKCFLPLSDQHKADLTQVALRLHDDKLKQLLVCGIAYHHAGVTHADRNLIEESFRKGLLQILLCTNTLALGVNLPAYLVIIKSTQSYSRGSIEEYSESTLLQMMGRAGRAQYDTKGVAVILTQSKYVRKYENMMNGKVPVESHLQQHLAEHLNSEIASGTIHNFELVSNWMRSTYLYVRSIRDPAKYGYDDNMDAGAAAKKVEEMCLMQVDALYNAGLVNKSLAGGLEDVCATAHGKLMARYYLSFETMTRFRQVRGSETFLEIFNTVVQSQEFRQFTLRASEKNALNNLNKAPIRFPISGRVKELGDKVSCLIQAVFGNLEIPLPSLVQESLKMIRIGARVSKCLSEYLRTSINQQNHFGRYKAVLHSVTVAKCFQAKLWENSDYAAKQLNKIGCVYSSLPLNAGKTTPKSITQRDARSPELVVDLCDGNKMLPDVLTGPAFSLQINMTSADILEIGVRRTNEQYFLAGPNNVVLLIGDSQNNLLLYEDQLEVGNSFYKKSIKIENRTSIAAIEAHVIHTSLVGVDVHASIVFSELRESPKPGCTKRKRQATCTTNASASHNLARFNFSKPKLPRSTARFTAKFALKEKGERTNLAAATKNFSLKQMKVTEFFSKTYHSKSKPNTFKKANIIKYENGETSSCLEPLDLSKTLHQSSINSSISVINSNDNREPWNANIPITDHDPDTDRSSCDQKTGNNYESSKTIETFDHSKDAFSNNMSPNDVDSQFFTKQLESTWNIDINPNNQLTLNTKVISEKYTQRPILVASEGVRCKGLNQFSESKFVKPIEKAENNCFHHSLTLRNSVPNILDLTVQNNNTYETEDMIEAKSGIKSCPSLETFTKWYKVTTAFLQLSEEKRSLANFQILYHKIEQQNLTRMSKDETIAPTRSAAQVPRRAKSNPFRLQIFDDHTRGSATEVSRSKVDDINRSIMNFVLKSKCDDPCEVEDYVSLTEVEELLRSTKSEIPKTFEDYCNMYFD